MRCLPNVICYKTTCYILSYDKWNFLCDIILVYKWQSIISMKAINHKSHGSKEASVITLDKELSLSYLSVPKEQLWQSGWLDNMMMSWLWKAFCITDPLQNIYVSPTYLDWATLNRPISQIPHSTFPISHNAPFSYRNVHTCAHFCFKMVHCGAYETGAICGISKIGLSKQFSCKFCYTQINNCVHLEGSQGSLHPLFLVAQHTELGISSKQTM